MELKKVLSGLDGLKSKGNLDVDVPSIACDSRKVTEGSMFKMCIRDRYITCKSLYKSYLR